MTSKSPRVLFFDPITWIHDWSYDVETASLATVGVEVVIPADRTERDRQLSSSDVVVVSSIDRLTADHVEMLDQCVGILCYSAGMDAVDLAAANRRRIPVANVQAGTADVADHAMTLLLAAWRMLPAMSAAAGAGHWDMAEHPEFRSIPRLEGSTVGIFGAGAIGRAVADRARAFGTNTIATYRRPGVATSDLPHVDLRTLFAESDAVILTASLTPSSHQVIDRSVLEHAGPGAVLVNVGRGALVVEEDLAWALDTGILRVAALDVRDPEPPDPATDPLRGRTDVVLTPHMAGVSSRALSSLHQLAADGIKALLRLGGRI